MANKVFALKPKHIHLIALIKENLRRPGTAFLAQQIRVHKNTVLYHLKILTKAGYLDQRGVPIEKEGDE